MVASKQKCKSSYSAMHWQKIYSAWKSTADDKLKTNRFMALHKKEDHSMFINVRTYEMWEVFSVLHILKSFVRFKNLLCST